VRWDQPSFFERAIRIRVQARRRFFDELGRLRAVLQRAPATAGGWKSVFSADGLEIRSVMPSTPPALDVAGHSPSLAFAGAEK
jgi:hypothetical protein